MRSFDPWTFSQPLHAFARKSCHLLFAFGVFLLGALAVVAGTASGEHVQSKQLMVIGGKANGHSGAGNLVPLW